MTTLAQRFQVAVTAVLRIVIQVRDGKHDLAVCKFRGRMVRLGTPAASMQAALSGALAPAPGTLPYPLANREPVRRVAATIERHSYTLHLLLEPGNRASCVAGEVTHYRSLRGAPGALL